MKVWVPLALGCIIVVAYAYFYQLTALEENGVAAIGMANAGGLALVLFGVIAAGLILRRVTPPT